MAWMQQNLFGGSCFNDCSILHHNDRVTYLCRYPEIVCNEYDADIPCVAYRLHHGKNLTLYGHIECRHRFVRNKNVGLERKRTSDANSLSLPAGELMRIPSQYIRLHPDETDQLGCLLSGLGAFDSKVQQPFDDRVSDSEPGIERAIWILENDLYPPAERPQLSRRQAGNILPAEVDLSRRRLNQP